MEDVAQMLKHIGVQPTMTKATVQRLEWFRDLNAREYFHEQRPVGCKEMAELWRSARDSGADT